MLKSGDSLTFLNLLNITFNSPFDIFIGIIFCLSLLNFIQFINQNFKIHKNELINFSIIYFLIIYIFSQIIFLITIVKFDYLVLRYFLYIFIIINLIFYKKNNYFSFFYKNIISHLSFRHRNRILLILILLFLISLSPASDVDSLDYHLGVPIQIIRDQIYKPDFYWIHSRVAGLGEFINLIGLSIGTKNLGSIIQFSSILVLIKIYFYLKIKLNSKFNFYLLIFSCPLIFTFLIIQKIQLLPNIGIILSILLLLENLKLDNKRLIYVSLFILFMTATFKYSFFINVFSVLFAFIILNILDKKIINYVVPTIVIFSITLVPLLHKNYFFFGDPLSPFLEFMKQNPNENIVNFSKVLSSDTYVDFMNFNIWTIAFFPFFLSMSDKFYFLNRLLGVGILFIYLFLFKRNTYLDKKNRFLIIIIFVNFLIYIFAVKQLTPRYYIDIYFILGILLIFNFKEIHENIFSKVLILFMKLEVLLVSFLLIFGLITLTSSSISKKLYDNFMIKSADGYSEARWADEVLPNDAKYISENSRSHSLFPRKHISIRQLFEDRNIDFIELIKREKITHMIISYPTSTSNKKIQNILQNCKNYRVIDTKVVDRGVRNPFSKWKSRMHLQAIDLKC
jgi:hypothetical protein